MNNRTLAPTLIGRQQELEALARYLQEAHSGQGQIVFVSGEAGVGKTRLVREFIRRIDRDISVEVIEGHCYDEHPAPPYGPFTDLIRLLVQVHGSEALVAAAGPWAADLMRVMPELLPESHQTAAGDDLQAARRRLFQAIYQVLRPQPEAASRMLILEDLHWSDQASQDLIYYLARAIEHDRVLIVATYRSDEIHRLHPLAALIARLTRDRLYQDLRLHPLSRGELAELLADTLEVAPTPVVLDALYERTEGNPFFTEEVLTSLFEHGRSGVLFGADAFNHSLSAVEIPLSIKDSVLRRVADLESETATVLRDAAVVGRRFDFDLLQQLTGIDEHRLVRHLAVLVERQLIVEERVGPEDSYRFRHELIREALYDELLRRERRMLHREVLHTLEKLYAADLAEVVDQLAYHALHARDYAAASHYSSLAAARALAVHAYREALGHYETALEALEQNDRTGDGSRRADILARLGHVAYLISEPRRSAGYWREALAIYEQLHQKHAIADVQRWLGRAAWDLGDTEEAFALTRAALRTLEGETPGHELARVQSALAHLYMLTRDTDPAAMQECINWGRRALELAEALDDDAVATNAHNSVGVALIEMGDVAAGLEHLERSLHLARVTNLPVDLVRAYINLGGLLCYVGQRRRGTALLREGWEYAASCGYIRGSSKLFIQLAAMEFEGGHWDRLDRLIEMALRPDYSGPNDDRMFLDYIRALLLFERGQPDPARRLLEPYVGTDSEHSKHFDMQLAHIVLLCCRDLGDRRRMLELAESILGKLRHTSHAEKVVSYPGVILAFLETDRRAEALELVAFVEQRSGTNDIRDQYLQAHAAEMRGLVELATDPAAALASFELAARIAEHLDHPLDAMRLKRRQAEALLRRKQTDDAAQAQQLLQEARAFFEPLGARRELNLIDALTQHHPPAATGDPVSAAPAGLTPRELEVLALITRGYSNRAIANALTIAEKTAEVHVRNILGKLGLASRTQAAAYAVELGLGRSMVDSSVTE
jgi:ATP/maltotriose-dependent transcriptional regulator MalT